MGLEWCNKICVSIFNFFISKQNCPKKDSDIIVNWLGLLRM